MPSMIIFEPVAPAAAGDKGTRGEALRVTDDGESAARKLATSKSALVGFETSGRSGRKVWVNRDQVRLVRDLPGKRES